MTIVTTKLLLTVNMNAQTKKKHKRTVFTLYYSLF